MDEILQHFETMGNHNVLVFAVGVLLVFFWGVIKRNANSKPFVLEVGVFSGTSATETSQPTTHLHGRHVKI